MNAYINILSNGYLLSAHMPFPYESEKLDVYCETKERVAQELPSFLEKVEKAYAEAREQEINRMHQSQVATTVRG